MIIGVGLDIEEVSRFEAIRDRRPGLIGGVFTPRERAIHDARPNPARGYTAGFAIKEAAFKALGQGWLESSLFWTDIELLDPLDQANPRVELSGPALKRCRELGIDRVMAVLDAAGSVVVAQIWLLAEDRPAARGA